MISISKPALAHVDGWNINTPNLSTAVSSIIAAAQTGKSFSVFTLNLDHLVKLRRNEKFRRAYSNADIVTADGAPVAWLARWRDPSIGRATGADMLLPLLQAAADAELPVYLFGSSQTALANASRELDKQIDGFLDVAGMRAPSPTFDPEGPEADLAIETIAKSGARLCIIALGAPKQEIFADRARAKGLACGMVCTGAAIDFIAGAQLRAPKRFRDAGFEWAWRLATNPRRLAKRYAGCAVVLADLLVLAPVRDRLAKARS